MKNNNILILLLALIMSSTSCKKEEPAIGGGGSGLGGNNSYATAQIEDVNFNATDAYAVTVELNIETINQVTTSIHLIDDNSGYTIGITRLIQTDSEVEDNNLTTYSMSFSNSANESVVYLASSSDGLLYPNGEVTITNESADYIEGAFSFIGVYHNPDDFDDIQEIIVGNGEFRARKIN